MAGIRANGRPPVSVAKARRATCRPGVTSSMSSALTGRPMWPGYSAPVKTPTRRRGRQGSSRRRLLPWRPVRRLDRRGCLLTGHPGSHHHPGRRYVSPVWQLRKAPHRLRNRSRRGLPGPIHLGHSRPSPEYPNLKGVVYFNAHGPLGTYVMTQRRSRNSPGFRPMPASSPLLRRTRRFNDALLADPQKERLHLASYRADPGP